MNVGTDWCRTRIGECAEGADLIRISWLMLVLAFEYLGTAEQYHSNPGKAMQHSVMVKQKFMHK